MYDLHSTGCYFQVKSNADSVGGLYVLVMMMAYSSQTRILGRLMVNSCTLISCCRVRFLMRTPYRTLDRRRLGMRMVGMLLALSASCVFPLRLYASLLRTHNWLFSLMIASRLGLRPPAAMADC